MPTTYTFSLDRTLSRVRADVLTFVTDAAHFILRDCGNDV